jgi:hypothetical protein
MKTLTKLILSLLTVLIFSCYPKISFAQAPNLGAAANFVLFSSVGAVGNTGVSQISGNVGTNNGAITNFGNINGVIHNADATTAQCVIDLQAAWYQLDTTTPTATHGPVLGNGETLYPGVYSLAAAASLVTVLTLDAQGDSNAIFIFKTGGAFTTAAVSTIILINGAAPCNIFWVAEGAIGLATLTTMKGTLLSHNGAISTGDGCNLEGRALSTTGSVTVYGTLATIPVGCGGFPHPGPINPFLGSLECYAIFSSNGAVSNSGLTNASGDVGTNNGSTTGYDPQLITGMIHHTPDSSTAMGATDLLRVYNYLDTLFYDVELLYPAQFGNKLILTPGVYLMNAAATLTDTLYLDAEGNNNAIFVIQINGALVTSTYATVVLLNGTQAENIYWKVEGAVTINDQSTIYGNIVCHNGAIVLTTGATLNGRALTITGALTTTATTVNKPVGGDCSVLTVELLSFTASCINHNAVLNWSTASESDNSHFSIERSTNGMNWQVIGRLEGAGSTSDIQNYIFTDKEHFTVDLYYRIRQTDIDGKFKYFKVILVKNCREDLSGLAVYPNPGNGTFNLLYNGNKDQVRSISIYNVSGEKIYNSKYYNPEIDLRDKPNGIYFLRVNLDSKIITKKIVIKK